MKTLCAYLNDYVLQKHGGIRITFCVYKVIIFLISNAQRLVACLFMSIPVHR